MKELLEKLAALATEVDAIKEHRTAHVDSAVAHIRQARASLEYQKIITEKAATPQPAKADKKPMLAAPDPKVSKP